MSARPSRTTTRRCGVRDYQCANCFDRDYPGLSSARRLDPSPGRQDFADLVHRRLDRAPEVAFTHSGLRHPEQATRVKDQFAA